LTSFPVDYRLIKPIVLHAQLEIRGFTALVGRSGAGKTSLLKALAGLLPAEGTPWAGLPPERRPVGYVPQTIALFPHLSVLQNAAFAVTGQDRLRIGTKFLHDLGISHLASRRAGEISGGEAQRVALARALAAEPELLLLDEPSAALDSATRDAVMTQLIDTIARTQKPALAATHDFAVAALADWVALLSDGRIIQQGTPTDVFNQPATAAAAQLVGYQNIWAEGGQSFAIRAEHVALAETGRPAAITSVRSQGAGVRLTCGDFAVVLPDANASDFEIGQVVHLRFPEKTLKILAQ
jgi:molybdate transport system ATP-binding protein